jgi:hypothetical protein
MAKITSMDIETPQFAAVIPVVSRSGHGIRPEVVVSAVVIRVVGDSQLLSAAHVFDELIFSQLA